ncbi:hypothetical protein [Oceanirhabdus sp. W0125-5]|uniref:hypothetical protein n=1 Tax=Oceanirhabdus sp. W0125-5 TaxID=2999116 RepID=UPI0022F2B46E|nr:hypothetical protein [Oceanirhabdus sp. W0125-5]WBW98973.1 hypothetical protein OW730_09565 [Oceanirhabdus sp. W0125-5]
MKKILSFILSVALLGNIACSTVALAETDSKVVKKMTLSTTFEEKYTDPDSIEE